jgi:hypothetical protein
MTKDTATLVKATPALTEKLQSSAESLWRLSVLGDICSLRELMERLCISRITVDSDTHFDDNNYFTVVEPCSLEVNLEEVEARGGLTYLQEVMAKESFEPGDFGDLDSVEGIVEYLNSTEFYVDQLAHAYCFDFEFIKQVLLNKETLSRDALAQAESDIVSNDLPAASQLFKEAA